jgi:TRAP-type C4-dicarboxylate transport system permease small subunit
MRVLGSILDRILSAAIALALLGVFFLNMYQVIGRYLFGIGAVWIPDLTRLLFIWMVFLGTVLMYLRRRHLVIDFVQVRMPAGVRRATETLIAGSMLAFSLILSGVGWRIAMIRMDIPYTGLEIPTGTAYLAVPFSGVLLSLVSVMQLRQALRADSSPASPPLGS